MHVLPWEKITFTPTPKPENSTYTSVCECGAQFEGRGVDDFSAAVDANRKRAQCRQRNPEQHEAMAQANRIARRIGQLPLKTA